MNICLNLCLSFQFGGNRAPHIKHSGSKHLTTFFLRIFNNFFEWFCLFLLFWTTLDDITNYNNCVKTGHRQFFILNWHAMNVAEISQLTFNFFLIFQYIISCFVSNFTFWVEIIIYFVSMSCFLQWKRLSNHLWIFNNWNFLDTSNMKSLVRRFFLVSFLYRFFILSFFVLKDNFIGFLNFFVFCVAPLVAFVSYITQTHTFFISL